MRHDQFSTVQHGAEQAAAGRLGVGLGRVERGGGRGGDHAGGDTGTAGAEKGATVAVFLHGGLPWLEGAVILP